MIILSRLSAILEARVLERRQQIADEPILLAARDDLDYYHRLTRLSADRRPPAAAPGGIPAPANHPLAPDPAGRLPKSSRFG